MGKIRIIMPKSRKSRNTSKTVEWGKFGLNEPPQVPTPHSSELIQEFEAASHITLEGNELFAEELVRFNNVL